MGLETAIKAPEVKSAEANDASDMFSLQVSVDDESGDVKIRSIVVHQQEFKHRITFYDKNSLQDVLTADFVDYLLAFLRQIDQSQSFFISKDTMYSTPGLAMGRMRILAHKSKNKKRHLMVGFKYLIGSLQQVMRSKTSYDFPNITAEDSLATSNLRDILAPISKSVDQAIDGFAEGKEEFLGAKNQRLMDTENDLLFYIQLLKRYVKSNAENELECTNEQSKQIERH